MKSFDDALASGLNFLLHEQKSDGSFDSFSSASLRPFTASYTYTTTFTPAIILTALCNLDGKLSAKIRNPLARWLMGQRSAHWSFNYWAKSASERSAMPYPDDLDDTFCALTGLYQHDSKLIDGAALAKIVKLLVATEDKPGGPYRTWLMPKTADAAWLDIDLAVNANIDHFLSLVSNPLPNLTNLMEKAIDDEKFESPYYPGPYAVIYYFSRAYNGVRKQDLIKYISKLQKSDGSWGTPMKTALAVSSLVRLEAHESLGAAQKYLLNTQQSDGGWMAEAFCLDPVRNGKKHYSGAPALTTALVLEALGLLNKATANKAQDSSKQVDKHALEIFDAVIMSASASFSGLGRELSSSADGMVQRFAKSPLGKDVLLLPYEFNKSVNTKTRVDDQFFLNLGLANLYGWIAYTIYDDFLDDEGQAGLLPVANAAMRGSVASFRQALPDHQDFQDIVDEAFNIIDSANAWEVSHCRFPVAKGKITIGKLPNYGNRAQLAERSLGHMLTPLAIMAHLGVRMDSDCVKGFGLAFRHYLIARQLNDDLHDWEEDIKKGHITYVVQQILEDLAADQKPLPLTSLLAKMQSQFWHQTVTDICQTVTNHTSKSRKALRSCNILEQSNIIINLLDDIDATNEATLQTVAGANSFIKTYKDKSNA